MNSSVSTEAPRVDNNSPARSGANRLEAWVVGNSDWLALVTIAAALAVRIAYAASCYLNPDEIQHFSAARHHTWLEAYRASTDLAHPPLFILVLHAVLYLGNTLCAKMSETRRPWTITVGRGKKSHFDEHKQYKHFFRCVGSFGA